MEAPGLWAGILVCAALTAVGLLADDRRQRLGALAVALIIGAALIAGDGWNREPLTDLRDSPLVLVAIAAAGAALIAAGAGLFVRHRWLLPVALVAALPFRIPVDIGGTTSNLLLPLYGVIAAGVLAAIVVAGREGARQATPPHAERLPGPLRWVPAALAAFIALYAIQAVHADPISDAVEVVAFFLVPFAALFVLLLLSPWPERTIRLVVVVAVAEALLVAVVGFGQYAAGEVFWNQKVIAGNEAHQWFRVNSLFWDPNIMGRYLAVTMIVLAAVVVWALRLREQLAAAALFVVLLGGVAITFSQTSLFALIAGLLALIALRWGLLSGGLALLAVVAGLLAATAVGGDGAQTDASGRTGLISGGVELARERPLVGHGSGTFAERFEATYGGGDGLAVVSHTEPVTVAAEQGAVGLLAYLALLAASLAGLAVAALRGGSPVAGGLFAAYVAMVVHSLGYAAFFTDPITWALLGLALALPLRERPAPAPAAPQPALVAEPV
jgi:putative inorganic carbon (hco3(-)) transporter